MAKANSTSFKKGQVANPNGRTKGAVSEYRRKFAEIAKMAANDAPMVYQQIRQFMELGESWAFQLYIKDIVPKKAFQPVVQVKTEEGKTRLETVTAALSGFTELTHEEAMEEIKAFKNAPEKEELKEQGESVLNLLDGDKIDQIYKWLEEAKQKKLDN
ncbi:MAG TPA: hypothetical protein PKN32_08285 [Bacteroidales bacterium]|jgi:hypothetical protein|nr:hypothetical protein [Bacteroidales bacterium]